MKNPFIYLIVFFVVLFLLPVLSFFNTTQDFWSHFGEYMSGILTPLIAALGIAVTISLNYISLRNLEKQRMLQRPLLFLRRIDFVNHIELQLQNKGLGPSVITSLILKDSKGKENKGIFDVIKGIELDSDTYTGDMDGLVLSANKKKTLFKITESCPDFEKVRPKIRKRFSDLELIVEYKDIYEEKMPTYRCKLSWYGRVLKQNSVHTLKNIPTH